MYDFLVKKGTTVAFLVGALVIALFIGSTLSGLSSAGLDSGTDLLALGKDKIKDMTYFDLGLKSTAFLLLLAFLAAIFFFLVDFVKFPKNAVKSLGLLVGLVALYFISKAISPADVGESLVRAKNTFDVSEGVSGLISGGIMTTVILIAAAIITMIFFEIRNAFK